MGWKKGQSGNPHGRAPIERQLAIDQLLGPLVPKAVARLHHLLASDNEDIQLKALRTVFERVYGMPKGVLAGDTASMALLHMIAARSLSDQLQSLPLQLASVADVEGADAPVLDLDAPAEE